MGSYSNYSFLLPKQLGMCVRVAALVTTAVMLIYWDPMDKEIPWSSKTDWSFAGGIYIKKQIVVKITHCALTGSVGWASSCKAKGHWFDFPSGHMPRLRVWSPIGAHTRGT